jgi:ferritin-like metal-binding protein YciE
MQSCAFEVAETLSKERRMAKVKLLEDALYETLKDVFFAEKQSVKGLKKSAKVAKSQELKEAFQTHAEESAGQVERLQQVFEILGKPARSKTCEAMQGLTSEMDQDLKNFSDSPAADAVLIGCAQAIEHYEIARYGTLKTWAMQLGLDGLRTSSRRRWKRRRRPTDC